MKKYKYIIEYECGDEVCSYSIRYSLEFDNENEIAEFRNDLELFLMDTCNKVDDDDFKYYVKYPYIFSYKDYKLEFTDCIYYDEIYKCHNYEMPRFYTLENYFKEILENQNYRD